MARIVVDAMGSDNYPKPDVEGAVQAAKEFGVEVILVGNETLIQSELNKYDLSGLKIEVVNAPETLAMGEKGENLVLKARAKDAKNSMALGIDLVKNGQADAFVTAGNTGAGMVTALFRLGRIRGVDRPALAPIFPTATGICVVLDIGANPDCTAENLYQFGILGSIYAEKVLGIKQPKVGLVSNAEEDGKGNELVKAATPLFRAAKFNYFGSVEGKEVIGGKVDVAVTDGFTGNVMLKSSEAVAKLITDKIREIIKNGSLLTKLGGMLVRPALRQIKQLLDPSEQGAAPLLGINGLVFIGHGRSDALAIKSAVRVAKHAVDVKVLDAMKNAIEESLKK
ncbi:MAG: phosphate acyltransferase PlsX [Anaerolineales bacterium]|nr:phosphate acyltransferase PlsX [Anaerolineales bacterium]